MKAKLHQVAVWFLLVGGLILALDMAFPPPLGRGDTHATLVLDRTGKPLRAFAIEDGRWRFAADLERIDPRFIDGLLAVEDKRFYTHWGVDIPAVARAALSSLSAGRVVSGASTLTMQTARLLEPRARTLPAKLIEMIRAVQIERRLSKSEILELYLTLTPYGGNLEGIEAASWAWFGRSPDRLSDDQIALLIALPQAPEARRPDRYPTAARAGRDRIAAKLAARGIFPTSRQTEIAGAPLPRRRAFPAHAWHGSARARHGQADSFIRSTLDAGLQNDLEHLIQERAARLEPEVQIAALVIDIPSRAVRAHIGAADRARPGGWIDLTGAARSPGSTLKPFIYGFAFDDGLARPQTRITDLPKRFSTYRPENFDKTFRGDVTIADALKHSLNVPAVLTLDRVGPERFAAALSLAGAHPRIFGHQGARPGLALALGGAGLTLKELAILYAALGDGGVAKPLIWQADSLTETITTPGQRLLSPGAARDILTILRATPSPKGRIPARLSTAAPDIAFKTGTSYGYRDALAAGIVGDLAIVVWVGRADGGPRPGETGRKSALPLLFDIADRAVLRLGENDHAARRLHTPIDPLPRFAQARFARATEPPEILFPPDGSELWAGVRDGESARPFVLAGRGISKLNWYIDGLPTQRDDAHRPIWQPAHPGFYTVSAVDAAGRSTHVNVRVLVDEAS